MSMVNCHFVGFENSNNLSHDRLSCRFNLNKQSITPNTLLIVWISLLDIFFVLIKGSSCTTLKLTPSVCIVYGASSSFKTTTARLIPLTYLMIVDFKNLSITLVIKNFFIPNGTCNSIKQWSSFKSILEK